MRDPASCRRATCADILQEIGQGWAGHPWASLFGLHSANISYIGVGHASPNSLPHGNVPMFGLLSIDRCVVLHSSKFSIGTWDIDPPALFVFRVTCISVNSESST